MRFPKRNPIYFAFIGVQTVAVILLTVGYFEKKVARDPDVCDEKAGLLMVQIGCTIETSIKLVVLILFFFFDRLSQHPESFGKPIFCFLAAGIIWIISIFMLILGPTLMRKASFWLGVQGLSFLNEGFFNLYHLRTYKAA